MAQRVSFGVHIAPVGRTLTKPVDVWRAWADDVGNAADESSLPGEMTATIDHALQRVVDICDRYDEGDTVVIGFMTDEVAVLDEGDWLTDEAFAAAVEWAESFR